MAVPVLPYTVHYYNSLPELQAAKDQFESTQASDILFTKIGKAIVKHGVEKMLGIVLLHNHFLLERHEMLVNFDSVAVPLATGIGTKELGAVSACAWRCVENGIAPYEFTHVGEEIRLDSEQVQSFLAEFGAILAEKNLSNILGICSLKEKPFDRPTITEFTSGRANITLPFDITPNDGSMVDAMWQFGSTPMDSSSNIGPSRENPKDYYGPNFVGQCKNRCKGKPHASRHIPHT